MKLYVFSFSTFVGIAFSFFIFLQPSQGFGKTNTIEAKSFREWKFSMVKDAELKVKATQNTLSIKAAANRAVGLDPNLSRKNEVNSGLNRKLQDLLEKEQLQLSLAQDLTISDYFIGYLAKQKEPEAVIKEVSTKLTADEVAELMMAYANHFFATSKATEKPIIPQADLLPVQ